MRKLILSLILLLFVCNIHAQSILKLKSYAKITQTNNPYHKTDRRIPSVVYLHKGGWWEVYSEGKHYTLYTEYTHEAEEGYYYRGFDNLGRRISVSFLNVSFLAGRLLYQLDIRYIETKNKFSVAYLIDGTEMPSALRF
ncbi:hypothetical protein CRM71_15460 [Prevotella jejuni]|uniref:Uncharacterized protein n=1 Tax=Prevotella jejuni TaxID=1177574 RepID=A0A2N9QSD1_9BACT|nr:hypothetical protein [Prevotella jejuni]AUI56614.1 hypothetical protein CRM71_15460 [Prevotella jejuni]SNS16863.1 hypothetical protein SAMN06265364_1578 [Prevotella jejuni]